MQDFSFLVAFGAGLASFLTPCVLPMVPIYLANLCGSDVFTPQADRKRLPIFMHSLSFVIGFSIVFILLGLSAGSVGFAFSSFMVVTRQVAGGLLILFGVFMLASLKIPWLNYEKHLSPSMGRGTSYLRNILTGGLFSLAWTPCVGPILGGILSLAMSTETAPHGAWLMAVYSLGLGVPFLAIAIALDSVLPLLKQINRYSVPIYIVSGILLIGIGTLILTNKLDLLRSF
jgi:cytochrome c-type biogenesis protein